MATTVPPNQSLYLSNLPSKYQTDSLKRELYALFSTYGPVLDITALKTQKMRGQAHILFRDVQSATTALRQCQGFEMNGQKMKIEYSKNRSNTLAKLTGTVGQPVGAGVGEERKGAGIAVPGQSSAFAVPGAQQQSAPAGLPPKPAGAAPVAGTKRAREEEPEKTVPVPAKKVEEEVEEVEMEVEDEEMEMSDDDD